MTRLFLVHTSPFLHQSLQHGIYMHLTMYKLLTKDSVRGVHGDLVLSGVANQPLGVCEGYITWGGAVSLVIGNDLHFPVLENAYTGICGSKIYADGLLVFTHLAIKKNTIKFKCRHFNFNVNVDILILMYKTELKIKPCVHSKIY